MAERKERIVMFPFMAQGHIFPFLALANQLVEKRNFSVTFINTPLNIKKIRPSLPPNSSIHLLEIPFDSSSHGLPPNAENTDVVSLSLIVNLFLTSYSFEPAFKELISNLLQELGKPPLCVISDMFFPWTAKIAHEFGAYHAVFNAGGCYGMACFHTLISNLSNIEPLEDVFPLPGFPKTSLIHINEIPDYLKLSKSTDLWVCTQNRLFNEWLDSDWLLCNTVEEFDELGLEYFRKNLNLPVWPVGPVLLSTDDKDRGGKESGIQWEIIEKWLDTKPCSSVLYISFGSQSTVSMSQMMQIGMALEKSGKNFIWVVRPPMEFDPASEFKINEWLPKGFEQLTSGHQNRGLLVHNWAPQLNILSHKSVSAFLTHCGWNSVLESLTNGVPLISWPMISEQHFNAKMLEEEEGVCIRLAEGMTCEVRYEEILEKIELAMNETEKGMKMRRKASEIKEVLNNAVKSENGIKGSSAKAIDEFISAAFLKREMTQTR